MERPFLRVVAGEAPHSSRRQNGALVPFAAISPHTIHLSLNGHILVEVEGDSVPVVPETNGVNDLLHERGRAESVHHQLSENHR